MKLNLKLLGTSLMALSLAVSASAQNIALRYGQIPSTIKTVSALQSYLALRKGLFAREGIALEMIPIDGGSANMVLALNKSTVEITRTATPLSHPERAQGFRQRRDPGGKPRHRSIV